MRDVRHGTHDHGRFGARGTQVTGTQKIDSERVQDAKDRGGKDGEHREVTRGT